MPAVKEHGVNSVVPGMEAAELVVRFKHVASGHDCAFVGVLTNWVDNYTSNWNEEAVYGRMDPIATYQNTTRKITIGWVIISESEKIGKENMRQLSRLIQFLYPTYQGKGSATSISSSPLLKMRFSNLANSVNGSEGLTGYINGGVSVTPVLESGFLLPKNAEAIPKTINIEITFSVLHRHDLGFSTNTSMNEPKFPYGYDDAFTAGERRGRPGKKGKAPPDDIYGPIRGAFGSGVERAGDMVQEKLMEDYLFGDQVPEGIVGGGAKKMLGF